MGSVMNKTADPCADFFQFTCGNWETAMKARKLPAITSFMAERSMKMLEKALDSLVGGNGTATPAPPANGTDASGRVAAYFNQCLDQAALDTAGGDVLQPLVSLFGSAASMKDLMVNAMSLGTNLGFFEAALIPDIKVASTNTLALFQPFPLLETGQPAERAAYVTYIDETLAAAKVPPRPNVAQDIINLDEQLLQMQQPPPNPDDPASYNKIPLSQLPPGIQESIAAALASAGATSANGTQQVLVDVPAYYQQLGQVMGQVDGELAKYYVMWKVIAGGSLDFFMPASVMKPKQDFLAKAQGQGFVPRKKDTKKRPGPPGPVGYRPSWRPDGFRPAPPKPSQFAEGDVAIRKADCMESVSSVLKFSTAPPFLAQFLPVEAKNDLLQIHQSVVDAYIVNVNAADFMLPETKAIAVDKLKKVTVNMAFPDYINDAAEVTRREGFEIGKNFFETGLNSIKHAQKLKLAQTDKPIDKTDLIDEGLLVPNAFHIPTSNANAYLASMFQFPAYHLTFPKYINFGASGSVMGHEMGHVLDDQGRLFRADGVLEELWQQSDIKGFNDRAQCFVDQYSNFTLFNTIKINGTFTLGENLSDAVGINSSFRGYKSLNLGDEPRIPGLEEFTSDQMFFISYASSFCEIQDQEFVARQVVEDPHSPGIARVNQVMIDTPAFAEAFKCPATAPVNTQKRCLMW
ncbi:hypothetical protein BC832DRAFT_90147 [Gaertneriomyces semiglobifer]|nr:hypothetical protein BC832DRAFT_90147 [Gaertneriomyces semiglobifer]